MKEPVSLDGKQKTTMDELYECLFITYPSQQIVIAENEKAAIKKAIQDLEYPYLMHDILHYINRELAHLLANSSNSVLSRYGNICANFYQENSLNKYVDPKTGIVFARIEPIRISWHDNYTRNKYKFDGEVIWSISKERWCASPTTTGVRIEEALDAILKHADYRHNNFQAIRPISMSDYPIPLVSPVHIAAALGDIHLLKSLKIKGASLEDTYHEDCISPLAFAIALHQKETVLFLMKENPNGFAHVVAEANFEIIGAVLAAQDLVITDKILEIACRRCNELSDYLALRARIALQNRINKTGAVVTLMYLLHCPEVPMWLLTDLIKTHPQLRADINNQEIIHQLIRDKKNHSVIVLLDVLFRVNYEELSEFKFDINASNSENISILDLALDNEHYDNELVFAILMHTPKMHSWQSEMLQEQGFDFNELSQTQKEWVQGYLQHIHRKLEESQKDADAFNAALKTVKDELAQVKRESATQQSQIDSLFKALKMASHENKLSEDKNMFFQLGK